MDKTRATLPRILVIVGFSLSCFGLIVFLWLSFGGTVPLQPKGYRVQASFQNASQLADQADVRVAGITVGKVVDKVRDPAGNRTLATLELEAQYVPLRKDARAILRQKTLLGETYVQLTLGTPGGPAIADGGRLADGQVEPTVPFDDFLRIFGPETRRAFRQWQQSAAEAGRGRTQDLSDALGNLPVFTDDGSLVLDVLARRQDALASLVRGTDSVFSDLTRDQGALQGAITSSTQVFATLSRRHDALAASIKALPPFLRQSRLTFTRLARFSDATTPLVRSLRPVLRDTTPTVAALARLSPDLRNLFNDLPPLITASRTGLPALSSVLRGLTPTLAALGPFLQQVNPILQYLEVNQPTVSDFLNLGPSALGLKLPAPPGSASNGHALPQLIVAGSQTLPAVTRTADNRGDAYLPPGALALPLIKDPTTFTLPSFDCKHVGGPKAPTTTPGCFVAPDVPFQGRTQHFPQVQAALPGGVDQAPR